MKWERRALAFAAVILLCALGGHDLWAPDEPFFAEGAREMLVDGHWAVPHINGELNNHKQALFFWLIAFFSMPFGAVTPLSARLPSALAALGTLAVMVILARRLYGPRTAAMSALVLSTSLLFWDKGRTAQIDATLCLFIWISLAAFATWRAGLTDGRRAGLVFWIGAALATLAKGPVGLALILGIAVATLAFDRKLFSWRNFSPLLGPAVFTVLVGAWMAFAVLGTHGEYSVWGALKEHLIDRGMHGMHHNQPFWYYAEQLPSLLFPWSALAVGAVVLGWRRRRRSGDRFLLIAAAFVVLFFSVSTEKRGIYVLPSLPAFALLVARLIAAVQGWAEDPEAENTATPVNGRWVWVAQGVTGVLVLMIGAAMPLAARQLPEVPGLTVVMLAVALMATGIVVVGLVARKRAMASGVALGVGVGVAYLMVVALVYPSLEARKSARPLARVLKEVSAESRACGNEVLTYDLENLPTAIAFYSDGMYTLATEDITVLEDHLLQEATVYAAVRAEGLDRLSVRARQRVEIIHETRLSRRDVYVVSNVGTTSAFAQPEVAPLVRDGDSLERRPPTAD